MIYTFLISIVFIAEIIIAVTIAQNLIKLNKKILELDEDLTKMYSFGRLYPYNPFLGGFVHEGLDRGTFKRFKKTNCEWS